MTIPKELTNAVETYFDGLHECDVEKLKSVFHPASSLFDADDGNANVETIDSFAKDVSTRISPQSVGQTREAETLMIDLLSPVSATVKVRIRTHQNVFVDHLGFVKGENGWQVVSKIWHLERVVEGVSNPNATTS